MKKLTLATLAATAALGLAACDSAPEETTTVDADTTLVEPAPTATETMAVPTDGTAPADGATPTDGSTVSVGPDGVTGTVDAGDTRVSTDGTTTTVETN